jgi:hypothetical protein
MKRVFILISTCLFTSSLFAQLNKGQWLAGGNAGFAYENSTDNDLQHSALKQTDEQFAPAVGYFLLDKLCAGIRIASSFSNSKNSYSPPDSIYNSKSTSYGISAAPFVRYYFLPKKNKVNLLAEAMPGFLQSLQVPKAPINTLTNKTTTAIPLPPGLRFS